MVSLKCFWFYSPLFFSAVFMDADECDGDPQPPVPLFDALLNADMIGTCNPSSI